MSLTMWFVCKFQECEFICMDRCSVVGHQLLCKIWLSLSSYFVEKWLISFPEWFLKLVRRIYRYMLEVLKWAKGCKEWKYFRHKFVSLLKKVSNYEGHWEVWKPRRNREVMTRCPFLNWQSKRLLWIFVDRKQSRKEHILREHKHNTAGWL